MNIPRNFVLVGTLFLVIGSHMGARGKHDFAPLHAHLSLLGFVLSMVFALTSRSFQELAASKLATYHFQLQVAPSILLLFMLFLLMNGTITDEGMVPIAPIAELLILVRFIRFGVNTCKNANQVR